MSDSPLLSRGEFSTSALAAALGTAGAPLLAAPAEAAPRRGGRLRIAWSSSSANDTLNPVKLISTLDFLRCYSLMSPLVKWDRQFRASPDLATSWDQSGNGTVWSFKLRKGVQFHNGKSLTPADVVYSLNLHRGTTASLVKSYFLDVVDLTADGNDAVKIILREPNFDFPVLLGDPHTVIVPAGFTAWDAPIGTGPFQLVSFRPGIGMLAKRNPNYYKAASVYLDEVESLGIADTSARISALLAGDVQYIVRVDAKSAPFVKQARGVDLVVTRSSRSLCINMRADRPPFDNADLREAMKYAVDRQAMLATVLRGFGTIANDLTIGPGDRYYCSHLQQRRYDPERASALYKRSGHTGPLELFSSDVDYGAPAVDYAVQLQGTAAKAGIPISITRLPADGYYAYVNSTKKPFFINNWFARPTYDLELRSVNVTNAPQDDTGYHLPRLDQLIAEARSTPDGPKRAQLYCDIETILWQSDGRVIPVFIDFIDGKSSRLGGVTPHPFAEAAGLRLCEEAWLS